ncbi:MAG: homocysteine S-methyltransferase family protein [Lachnospiraceae bacterium]|nr:homocysteine S-methyltransferase family protein [Lachnospiraceae bacterium]
MEKKAFRELVQKKIVILDGATGSNLQKSGMPVGVCPEQWIIENSQIMKQLQIDYIKAGTDILYAPTFTCNRIKLEEYGLQDQLVKMNHRLVEISKEAVAECGCQEKVFVAGDLTMTGQQLYPVGKLQFEELVEIYKEQAGVLIEAGVDLFVVETMMSLQECRAAVLAIKEICNLPIMVTLTFNEDERTLFGTDAKTAVVVLQSLGADAVGLNCSTGPDKMHQIVEDMRSVANIPLIAKPNAGLPELKDGETVFDMEPQEFAEEMEKLVEKGISIVGGCCGTTPKHISRMKELVEKKAIPQISKEKVRAITTERKTVEIDINGRFMVVGERINPTGKKALQAELREGKLDIVTTFVEEQVELGADILDVNVGMNGIDEKQTMLDVINHVTMISNIPLSIDSSSIDVLEAALRIYPGRALINSISLESEKFEKLIPIAKKYGAMFILLPLSDEGLPKDIQEKKDIIGKILDRAYSFGMTKEDVVVDGLVNTIGANKRASVECMETIQYCKQELGVATICGLSNISFGLPERQFVNSTFLAFAIKEGLTMAIANPSQDLLMNVAVASDLLMNREEADIRYIDRVSKRKFTMTAVETKSGSSEKEQMHPVFEAVVKGNRKGIVEIVKKAIEEGFKPNALIDDILIPAINHVGKLFDEMIYFLPQLISSAEAMETAIDYLEPLLEKKKNEGEEVTIVFATVEGDIHDIGKNLVVLMLKNYGYRVIDLGKDVPSDIIIETAKREHAKIIGLSALMTTTMMQMKEVVDKVRAQNLDIKVIIGGAVITQSFADEIGADGYSKDAQEAVGLVKNLL